VREILGANNDIIRDLNFLEGWDGDISLKMRPIWRRELEIGELD
jgi:hypothetical protein